MSELIDKEALLDECLNHYEVGNIEQNCTMDWVCKTVRNFPAASPWHRVEEPPKENGRYLVSWEGAVTTDEYKNGVWLYASMFNLRVTHWIPLPEPPKEDA